MRYSFDQVLNRRATNSTKWNQYPADVIPLWVADMDFRAPQPILDALRARLDFGVLGYDLHTQKLQEAAAARMESLYGWQLTPEMVVPVPGIVSGFNAAAWAACNAGDGILIQAPVYFPFLSVSRNVEAVQQTAGFASTREGAVLHYDIDFDSFRSAIDSLGAKTHLFLLCSPHNPLGRMFSRDELLEMAAICLEHGIVICSDEIHSELILEDRRHVPLASLSPEIAEDSITLISPSKTFNIAGLFCGLAIIPNSMLRERFKKQVERLTFHVNSLGILAAQVALSGICDDWLAELLLYLRHNRDFVVDFAQKRLPALKTTKPEATFLAWLDCREFVSLGRIETSPFEFFLTEAKVGFNDGAAFGPGGEGFVRLNFGCPKATVTEALERIEAALSKRSLWPN